MKKLFAVCSILACIAFVVIARQAPPPGNVPINPTKIITVLPGTNGGGNYVLPGYVLTNNQTGPVIFNDAVTALSFTGNLNGNGNGITSYPNTIWGGNAGGNLIGLTAGSGITIDYVAKTISAIGGGGGTNFTTAGTNIVVVGTAVSLASSLTNLQNITALGNIQASGFFGNGANVTSLNGANVTATTLNFNAFDTATKALLITNNNAGPVTINNSLTASSFTGVGTGLTAINGANINATTINFLSFDGPTKAMFGQHTFTNTTGFVASAPANIFSWITNSADHTFMGFGEASSSYGGVWLCTANPDITGASLSGYAMQTILNVPNAAGQISFDVGGTSFGYIDSTGWNPNSIRMTGGAFRGVIWGGNNTDGTMIGYGAGANITIDPVAKTISASGSGTLPGYVLTNNQTTAVSLNNNLTVGNNFTVGGLATFTANAIFAGSNSFPATSSVNFAGAAASYRTNGFITGQNFDFSNGSAQYLTTATDVSLSGVQNYNVANSTSADLSVSNSSATAAIKFTWPPGCHLYGTNTGTFLNIPAKMVMQGTIKVDVYGVHGTFTVSNN